MLDSLAAKSFQIVFLSHAQAIRSVDFPEALSELEHALSQTTIPVEEIIAGGGGEAKGTQRLRKALAALDWRKTIFTIEKRINGVRRETVSHEIDHVRSFGQEPDLKRIALEIEWNNKDPFYDRDLENFKRLHADGAISVGIIVTRGKLLQDSMRAIVQRFLVERKIEKLADLEQWGYSPTARQKDAINKRMTRTKNLMTLREAFTDKFVADKFGEATTHWRKLEDRIQRGVGNPCPLVLIGLPDSIVTFDEGKPALAEVEADEDLARGEN